MKKYTLTKKDLSATNTEIILGNNTTEYRLFEDEKGVTAFVALCRSKNIPMFWACTKPGHPQLVSEYVEKYRGGYRKKKSKRRVFKSRYVAEEFSKRCEPNLHYNGLLWILNVKTRTITSTEDKDRIPFDTIVRGYKGNYRYFVDKYAMLHWATQNMDNVRFYYDPFEEEALMDVKTAPENTLTSKGHVLFDTYEAAEAFVFSPKYDSNYDIYHNVI